MEGGKGKEEQEEGTESRKERRKRIMATSRGKVSLPGKMYWKRVQIGTRYGMH